MKKLFTLIATFFILFYTHSQSLSPSTIGQVYNLATGDSFEYTNAESEAEPGGGDEYYGYVLLVVDSVVIKANSYYYYCSATRLTAISNGGYGTSPQPIDYRQTNSEIIDTSSTAYFIVTAPDSSIFSIYDTVGNFSTSETPDTISEYHNRKQNSYSSTFGEASQEETYVEGIGLTSRSYNSYGTSDYVQLSLVYYHKADGGQWGAYTTYLLAVDEIALSELAAKISPNPIAEQFQLTLSMMPSQKFYLNIFDVTGREIRQEEVHSAINTYQRSNLPAGAYFWRIESDEQVYYHGILVLR